MRPQRRPLGPGAILLGLLALVWATLALPPFTPLPAAAAIPAPQPGHAVVAVYVGGDRETDAIVNPVQGATFGLFTAEPTSFNANGVYTGSATPVAECTSDGDGYCSFQVPIGAGGVTAATRLWVAPESLPAGWYSDPVWQTAPLTPTTADPRVQTPHVFQTPPLTEGNTYISGNTYSHGGTTYSFMGDPGSQTTPARPTGQFPNFTRRTASGGFWPLSRVNPDLTGHCGLNVAIIVDLSSSVAGYVSQIKGAIGDFVDGLRGTPSQAALFTFGTSSPAIGLGPNSSLMSVATTADANRFKQLYAGWTDPPQTNYTNWDAGLEAASAVNRDEATSERFDLAVVLTDGNPTVYGANRTNANIPANSGYTRFREMEAAVDSADRLKSEGTRILAMGVGGGLDAGAAANLRSISGQTAFNAGQNNILNADYFQEASYAAAGDALHDLVLASCAPSISVVKRIVPFGETTTANAYVPADPWTFSASTATGGVTVTPASGQTAPVTGAINFDIGGLDLANSPGSFSITETPQPRYSLFPTNGSGGQGTQNAVCENKSEDDARVAVTNTANGFTVPVGYQDALACVIYNQAPNFNEAHVVVHKRWQVTDGATGSTTTYANGAQPPDLEAHLLLSGPGPDPLQTWPWDDERHGYDATVDTDLTVAEHVYSYLPGCHLTGQPTIAGTGISGGGDPMTVTDGPGQATTATHRPALSAGENRWTITNHATCTSRLTLHKQVVGGTAEPRDWTLTAADGTHHSGRHGDASITDVHVPHDTPFTLAEHPDDDPELLNYVQDRLGPIADGASGSWECAPTGDGSDWTGLNGVVSVPLGTDVTCTAVNRTAELTIVKDVVGGSASASDWTFHAEPVAPSVDGLPSRTIAGSAQGTSVLVRPGQTYRVHETTDGHLSYQLSSFTCRVDGETRAGLDLQVPAGSHAICTATNSHSTWWVHKTADPPTGSTVRPGQVITYTITASHSDGAATHAVDIIDALANVLPHATVLTGSLQPSTGHATLSGDELIWHIPVLRGSETLRYQVRVGPGSDGATLHNVLTRHTTTEPGDPGDEAVVCPDGSTQQECDTVDLPVAEAGSLPDTGGPRIELALGGALILALGVFVVAFAASRRRTP